LRSIPEEKNNKVDKDTQAKRVRAVYLKYRLEEDSEYFKYFIEKYTHATVKLESEAFVEGSVEEGLHEIFNRKIKESERDILLRGSRIKFDCRNKFSQN
jgi:5-methylcytosine-specific restriction endonuclease McrBC GTP-binding regulatory subunit McrB